MRPSRSVLAVPILLIGLLLSCNDPGRPGGKPGAPINEQLLCNCKPTGVSKEDWRIAFKNIPVPKDLAPQDVTVAEALHWPEGDTPDATAPRRGKELTLYRIPRAYLESTFLREGDCDVHIEISDQPDKKAPRMIVETPGIASFCSTRRQFYSDLQQHGFKLTNANQEPANPIPVEIEGLAFRDEAHPFWRPRGSSRVATLWEIHPAVVKLLPK